MAAEDSTARPLPELVAEIKEAVGVDVETKNIGIALSEALEALGLPDEGTAREKAHRASLELGISVYTQASIIACVPVIARMQLQAWCLHPSIRRRQWPHPD